MGIKLVAYEGPQLSEKAVNQAIGLLKPQDELLLLFVVPVGGIAELADVPPDMTVARAQEMVKAEVEALRERGVRAMGMVKEGDIAEEILKMSSEMGVDIIVLGHRGLSKVGRFAVGSVVEHIYKHAERPVLIVK
jgi:nucleotide-binding universal stress UspA family protein